MRWLIILALSVVLLVQPVNASGDDEHESDVTNIRRPALRLLPASFGGHTFLKVFDVGDEFFFVGVEGVAIRWRLGQDRPQQLNIPVDVTLTSICFSDLMRGWIGGSEGSMFATNDGGVNWKLVKTGLTNDGPILDISCSNTGPVVGLSVFGQLTISDDGGDTWRTLGLHAVSTDGDEIDPHLLSIGRLSNGRLLIVGEMGASFTSDDGGKSWQEMRGLAGVTLFGQLQTTSGRAYVYGMEGRIWELGPHATEWSRIDTGVARSLYAATARDGVVLFFGDEGVWIALRSGTSSLSVMSGFSRERATILAACSRDENTLLLTTDGVYRDLVSGSNWKAEMAGNMGEKLWQ